MKKLIVGVALTTQFAVGAMDDSGFSRLRDSRPSMVEASGDPVHLLALDHRLPQRLFTDIDYRRDVAGCLGGYPIPYDMDVDGTIRFRPVGFGAPVGRDLRDDEMTAAAELHFGLRRDFATDQLSTAKMYLLQPVPQDIREARAQHGLRILRNASELDPENADIQFLMADLLISGFEANAPDAEGLQFLTRAATLGHGMASFELGRVTLFGFMGVQQDLDFAVDRFISATVCAECEPAASLFLDEIVAAQTEGKIDEYLANAAASTNSELIIGAALDRLESERILTLARLEAGRLEMARFFGLNRK
jgi:hypothetical protein